MSKPPLPDATVQVLAKANPGVIATLRPDGQPVTAATWYLWDDGRILVNMTRAVSGCSTCGTIPGSR